MLNKLKKVLQMMMMMMKMNLQQMKLKMKLMNDAIHSEIL